MKNFISLLACKLISALTIASLAIAPTSLLASNFETTELQFSDWTLTKTIHKMDHWGKADIYSTSKETINGQKSVLRIDCHNYRTKVISPFKAYTKEAIKINGEVTGYIQKGRITINDSAPKEVRFRFKTTGYSPISIDQYSLLIATPKPYQWIKENLPNEGVIRFGVHFQGDLVETVLTFPLTGLNKALASCPKDLPSEPPLPRSSKPNTGKN
ncbi:hypothetical protein [Alcanivorax jadensis]|jgi:hypothetical protein|uniref:hypothetical protein n=1 Tax=Alcanivorax jadensis TaxID=64988 RepID=UPI0012EC684C|nr:hypothetical protein [Alcanivorax jadensis]|tara:strand:+ start:239 stop:880 length:642 start_codon:yes stop_codon:yes gene_type:complete